MFYLLYKYKYVFLLFPFLLSSSYSEEVTPIDKIIKNKQTYYDFNGTSPLPTTQKDKDILKESGVILNFNMQKKLKDKKTPTELKESLAIVKGEQKDSISNLKKAMLRKPKYDHVFILNKKSKQTPKPPAKKSTMVQILYHGK